MPNIPTGTACAPTSGAINTALRDWWMRQIDLLPRDEQHEARRRAPRNFPESLDSCRLVRDRLPASLRTRFAALLMARCGGGWESLAFASAYDTAAALCDVLDLAVAI